MLAVVALLATVVGASPARAATADRFKQGESLAYSDQIFSPNGQFSASINDGNLVVYRAGFGVRWRSGTEKVDPNARLTLQPDNNLVLRTASQAVRWASNTAGTSPGYLQLGDDGNLVLFNGSGKAVWQSGSITALNSTSTGLPSGAALISPDGTNQLVMQRDGNLVVYKGATQVWSSNTNHPGSRLLITSTVGLAVVDLNNRLMWANRAVATPGVSQLAITNDPDVVLTDNGVVMWETNHKTATDCSAVTGPVPTGDTRKTTNGIVVHACTVATVQRMVDDAAAAGVTLQGSGWRDVSRQIELRIQNCGGNDYYSIWQRPSGQCSPPTAVPGRSMHERGLAIDFSVKGRTITTSDPQFVWLKANAAKYGYYNLPSETWHWSINGN